MRDGNADLVSAVFDAWNRRDLEALLALCEPDVEVRSLMTEAERATYGGARGVSDWLAARLSEAGRLRFWGFFRTEELAREAAGVQGYGRPISSTR